MAFKMKGPSIHQGTARHRSALKDARNKSHDSVWGKGHTEHVTKEEKSKYGPDVTEKELDTIYKKELEDRGGDAGIEITKETKHLATPKAEIKSPTKQGKLTKRKTIAELMPNLVELGIIDKVSKGAAKGLTKAVKMKKAKLKHQPLPKLKKKAKESKMKQSGFDPGKGASFKKGVKKGMKEAFGDRYKNLGIDSPPRPKLDLKSPAKQSSEFNPKLERKEPKPGKKSKKETERTRENGRDIRYPTPERKKKVVKKSLRETANSPTIELPTKKAPLDLKSPAKQKSEIRNRKSSKKSKGDTVKKAKAKDPIKKAIADKAAQVMAKPGQKGWVWDKAREVYKATKAHR